MFTRLIPIKLFVQHGHQLQSKLLVQHAHQPHSKLFVGGEMSLIASACFSAVMDVGSTNPIHDQNFGTGQYVCAEVSHCIWL